MVKLKIIFLFLLLPYLIYAQSKNDGIRAIYIYEWPKLSHQKEYTLLVKDGVSKYMRRQIKEQITTPNGSEFYFRKDFYDWYYDSKNKEITQVKYFDNDKKGIAKWKANLKWKIIDEFKEINGYKVQKATTEAHEVIDKNHDLSYGNVIAWFTTDIPIDSGPERYYGLPGLIVKIEFSNRSATSTLKEIYFENIEKIDIPKEGVQITKKEALKGSF